MGARESSKGASDAFAWALNVSTSVVIVFANKVLLDSKSGHGFTYATTLCGLHFLACAISILLAELLGIAKRAYLPWPDVLKFAIVANISIASLNLSLLVNTVGFYQVAKLLIIPFVCFMEILVSKKRITPAEALSILLVVAGVAVVTVTDVEVNPLGLLIAVVSVVSSGMQQLMCGAMQRKYQLSSHQLLSNTAHIQGIMLLAVGPYIDQAVSQRWILDYSWTPAAARQLAVSCALAVLVNISQFMCLGRFSAITFQVLGHAKTVLVLLASWIVFNEPMTSRKLLGIGMAVAGMVAFSLLGTKKPPAAAPAAVKSSTPTSSELTKCVTAEVALKPGRVPFKQAAATGAGLLSSYPINVTDDDSVMQVTTTQKSSDGGVSSDHSTHVLREDPLPCGDSIAAAVVRRHRGARA